MENDYRSTCLHPFSLNSLYCSNNIGKLDCIPYLSSKLNSSLYFSSTINAIISSDRWKTFTGFFILSFSSSMICSPSSFTFSSNSSKMRSSSNSLTLPTHSLLTSFSSLASSLSNCSYCCNVSWNTLPRDY